MNVHIFLYLFNNVLEGQRYALRNVSTGVATVLCRSLLDCEVCRMSWCHPVVSKGNIPKHKVQRIAGPVALVNQLQGLNSIHNPPAQHLPVPEQIGPSRGLSST